MLETTFSSAGLPPRERLAATEALFAASPLPMRVVAESAAGFDATLRQLDIAATKLMELAASPSAFLRTPRLIGRSDPEMLSVLLVLDGTALLSQAGRDTVFAPHQVGLYDSSRPFRIQLGAGRAGEGLGTAMAVHVPRALVGLPLRRLDVLLARPLGAATGSGFGGMLAQLLTAVATGSGGYRQADAGRVGILTHDLLTALIAHHLDAETAVPDDSYHRTLLLRIEAFAQRHLADPDLTPRTIAAAHGISVGSLHRLFTARETTVAAWVRGQRLERARQDLADPALRRLPVHRIAARWGFRDHATFTRAFRSAYAMTPKDHRAAAAAEPHAEPEGPRRSPER
ncbi:helix-turn-helix domain-containing protein [Streptomyces sp. V4-01]|uniref:Helix-turn-helix domain-containing protein n=1 Tax=Actinacidiphila polyblastidii TaxID=3110430 RepID=A0ABU7PJ91_9ACTN|nr:helix-turn-helix domain-containing protein [Streptomyces sp. V4-01]